MRIIITQAMEKKMDLRRPLSTSQLQVEHNVYLNFPDK